MFRAVTISLDDSPQKENWLHVSLHGSWVRMVHLGILAGIPADIACGYDMLSYIYLHLARWCAVYV